MAGWRLSVDDPGMLQLDQNSLLRYPSLVNPQYIIKKEAAD